MKPKKTQISKIVAIFFFVTICFDPVFGKPPDVTLEKSWKAGFAKVVITPKQPMFASGYGSRDKVSEGKVHDLYARVCVLEDRNGTRSCFVSLDLIGVSQKMAARFAAFVKKKHRLERSQLMLASSHTHSGPALDEKLSFMLKMTEEDWKTVQKNQRWLDSRIELAIDRAFANLSPAKLFSGNGKTTFAVNRRPPIGKGPVDHDVPVLKITTSDGKQLRGVVFGYACHNTTLNFYQWCGDYAGFAELYLENRYASATALFFSGCGADQNPLPRRKVELAEKYGRMLGTAVEKTLSGTMQPLEPVQRTAYREIDLVYDRLPSKEEIENTLKAGNRYEKSRARILLEEWNVQGKLDPSHSYPIQVWKLGNSLTWIALGGEVVVDYSLRLKKELGPKSTWVTGYANHVMAYIPSERILEEGGYEGRTSMVYYQLPSRWKAGLEKQIVDTIKSLVEQCHRSKVD